MSGLMPGFIAGLDFNQIRWNHRLYHPQTTISAPRQNPIRIDPVTTWDTVPKRRGCFSWRSASTAGLRQLGKTCELQLSGRFNRTYAAGLRQSVRPANCKRGPLTGLKYPTWATPFLSFSFSFSFFYICRFRITLPVAQLAAFSKPQGRSAAAFLSFLFFNYTLRLHSQPPALLQDLLFSLSVRCRRDLPGRE